ncbi:MAG: EF-P lysine aminoacylase GenX [Desulfobacteraceae bacterium]|nr:EF-P lysine aminoacylase GenX [Desulfobacteraceae bacterium]
MNKYRQQRIKSNLELRARIIRAIRRFFIDDGFLEVETPNRIPAPAPEAHIDAEVSGQLYLHTSPELCMKRLLAAGYSRIFQICKCYRRQERGRKHLPEMTLLEWYETGKDYTHMMGMTERLLQFIARHCSSGEKINYQGRHIDLRGPWDRLSVCHAFDRYAEISMSEALLNDRFDEVMGIQIEPRLGCDKPVFLYNYPAQCGALARLKTDDPAVAERFELYIAGLELCNGFSELTDPAEQRSRFEYELKVRQAAGKADIPLPEKFLASLKDMPEATGNALGMDRLVMLFTDTSHIDDVVAFTPEEL